MTNEYNGWTNYETWCVNLWLGNDEPSSNYWSETAQEIFNESETEPYFTKAERATLTLADHLKNELEQGAPELGASVWSDLLSAAVSEVNWYEIAEHFIADTVFTESTEYDDVLGSPDTYLADAQQYVTANYREFVRPGLIMDAFDASFDMLAHARAEMTNAE